MARRPPIRFGILGCAKIASQISRALSLAPDATVAAVASRSIDKAQKFASDNGLNPSTKIYGCYEALLDDPEVDAVYVPLPTSLHLHWVVRAAQRKKHVLLEKPVAMSVSELDQMLEACESSGVQFMDGTMWMHHPRTASMKHFLSDEQRFGQLKLMHSVLSFRADPDFLENDIRTKPELDGLGVLGDLGWYCIRAILWAADYELPKTVVALHGPVYNDGGVILSCGSSLCWEDGKLATFHCSYLSYLTFELTVFGTKGSLRVDDFVLPFRENCASFRVASEAGFERNVMAEKGWAPTPSEQTVSCDVPQDVEMVSKFAGLVGDIELKGLGPDTTWANLSRKTQLVLDAVKASIERNFEPVHLK